jgi:hypothetical protein
MLRIQRVLHLHVSFTNNLSYMTCKRVWKLRQARIMLRIQRVFYLPKHSFQNLELTKLLTESVAPACFIHKQLVVHDM